MNKQMMQMGSHAKTQENNERFITTQWCRRTGVGEVFLSALWVVRGMSVVTVGGWRVCVCALKILLKYVYHTFFEQDL